MALSFDVLRSRDFRLLLCIRTFGMMALQSQAVIVGWQVYSITRDPFMLGLTGLTEAIPAIICAFFAGHVVDNGRPHRIYLICMAVLVLNSLMLFIMAGGLLGNHDHQNILPWIYGGVFISGLARSFIMPASFSLLPQIVVREKISAAAAWLNSGFQIAAISGPAIAGLIYGGYGVQVAWILPVSFMSMAFMALASISGKPRSYRSREQREAAIQSIKAGWVFIWHNRVLLSVMALDMFAVLFGGAVAMLPAFADQVLHVGSQGLGALRAAPALGSIVTALILALWPLKRIRATMLLCAVTGFGCCMIGFGLSQLFWLSMLFLALGGMFDSISVVMRATIMQLLTPDSMRGRVSAVNSMFIISSNEIGAFESGAAASLLGLVPSVVFGGLCTLVVAISTATLVPKLRRVVVEADKPA
ncbi:MFS transporter [bacterium]|nr:MFS transporter [bacterium]